MSKNSLMKFVTNGVPPAPATPLVPPQARADLRGTFGLSDGKTQNNQQQRPKNALEQMREDAAKVPMLEAKIAELEERGDDLEELEEELAALRADYSASQAALSLARSKEAAEKERVVKLRAVMEYALGVLTVVSKGIDCEDAISYIKQGLAKTE